MLTREGRGGNINELSARGGQWWDLENGTWREKESVRRKKRQFFIEGAGTDSEGNEEGTVKAWARESEEAGAERFEQKSLILAQDERWRRA